MIAKLAAAAGSMTTLQVVGTALSAVSSLQQMQAGRAQAAAYRAQAKQEELKGRRAELRHRQEGVEVLRGVRSSMSTVTARAASGNIDPYTGTPQALRQYAVRAGTEEFYLAQENAELARVIGEVNAESYGAAATQARRQGMYNAIGTLGTTALTLGSIGSAPQTQPINKLEYLP